MITHILLYFRLTVRWTICTPSFNSEPTSNRAFADDFILLSDTLDKMKNLIELINEFPAWARLVYLLVGGKVVSELRWRTEKKLG